MYRLLIVTDDPAAQKMLAAMEGWEAMGFKVPRIRTTEEDAVECMKKHQIDAIAVSASPAFAGFMARLDEQYPNLPLFDIASTPDEQHEIVHSVYRLLSRLNADDSNDEYDFDSRMQQQRDRWMKKLISGLAPNAAELARQHRLCRCREQLDVPCVLARMSIPEDNTFMEERWRYGSERLETALRNFFGRETERMLMYVAVVSTGEVRLLCYPTVAEEGVSENAVFDYVQETIEQIDHYLGLELHLNEVRRLPGLAAFAADSSAL